MGLFQAGRVGRVGEADGAAVLDDSGGDVDREPDLESGPQS